MPKYIFRTFCVLILFSLSITAVHASMDPISATTSATAKVPDTVASSGDTTAPTPPILISPVDGTFTGDNRPEFIWDRSFDPNGNTVIYTLYLNGVATYLGISNVGNSAGPNYTARIDNNQVILKLTNSLLDGSYNWYVTASDPSGNTSNSTTWNLTIDTQAPIISITDIDTHHSLNLDSDHPERFEGLNFDIAGPKDIYFTVSTEPWSTLTLQFYNESAELVLQSSWPVGSIGTVLPYAHLGLGRYTLHVSSYDRGSNTTALPPFTLTIITSQISVTIPGIPRQYTTFTIPLSPSLPPNLPATVSQIATRAGYATLVYTLLAVGILWLLIAIWKRKPNILFLDSKGNPHKYLVVYHSLPNRLLPHTLIYATTKAPVSYVTTSKDHGKLYIKHLGRYSTLTVRIDNATHILSLSVNAKFYTIKL